ncbi:MAG: hypothetical protein ACREPG_07855 [Candidatus Binatia bacterium]
MRSQTFCEHRVELDSEEIRDGEWVARATVVIDDGNKPKRIPIYGRRRATFDTQQAADSYGFELAKLWIEGKMSGANGHGLPD